MQLSKRTIGISIAILIVAIFSFIGHRFLSERAISIDERDTINVEENTFAYQNVAYGFELSFPSSVVVDEKTETAPSPGGHVFRVEFSESEGGAPIAAVTVSRIDSGYANGTDALVAPNGMDPVSTKNIRIAGRAARVYNEGKEGTVFVVASDSYQYMIYPLTKKGGDSVLASFRLSDEE